jgi:aspartate 1-decarboxylase
MFRTMMKSKIHRATVTEANLNYVGSITIDEAIMEAVDILPNEKVQVVNNNNGARLETYAIPGPRGSGVICLNGAAARLVQPGDTVIIISYALMPDEQAKTHQPVVAVMNADNTIQYLLTEEMHGQMV